MNTFNRYRAFLVVLLTLGLAVLACGPSLPNAGPTPPGSPIPVTTEAAGQLEGAWSTAIASTTTQTVTVTMTEAQLTSYATIKLQSDPTSPITDTQIYLRSGKILMYGQIASKGSSIPAALTLSVIPNPSGTVSVTIDSLNIGPIPVPATLNDTLSTQLNDLIAQNVGTSSTDFKVTDVVINDGTMTVTGVLPKSQ